MAKGSVIKGISIEINGETTLLDKALGDVVTKSKSLQDELKAVERMLKLDPKNTELLAQKQKVLADAVEKTRSKLDALKKAQEQVNEQFKKGKISESQYRAFQREIAKTEQELKSLEEQLKKSSSTMQKFADEAKKAGDKLKPIGAGISSAGKTMSMAVTAPIVGVAGASAKLAMDFETQMSRVQGISGATADELGSLTEQALQLGSDTSFSAKAAADGMESLASAGFTTKEIMAAMPGLLDLAASSGEDLAVSSDIAASTLRGFGLEASQAGHVADVLAKNSASTNAAVADTGEAMKYIAPVASAMGLSLEEVAASIGIMANAGIKGSQAGTALRGSLARLADPSKEAWEAMDGIGFSAFDTQGKLLPMKDLIDRLQQSTKNLTDQEKQQAIAQIFGQEAMSGMLTLIKAGPDELDKLTQGYKNSDGAAKEMAATMLDNTKGSLEAMNGSLETAGIKLGTAMAPAIEKIAKIVGDLADKFSNLSPATRNIILIIGGIVAAIGPVLIIIGALITAVGTIAGAFATVSGVIAGAGGVFAALTGPIGLMIAAIVAAIAIGVALYKNWDKIVVKGAAAWNAVKAKVANVVASIKGIFTGLIDRLKLIGREMITGLWSGILEKLAWIKEKISTAMAGITQKVKDVLGIHSPSRVYAEIGRNISAGLANGITGKAGTVKQAINGMLNAGDSARMAMADQKISATQTMAHTGTIRVEGINSAGELIGVTEIIAKQYAQGVRRMPTRVRTIPI